MERKYRRGGEEGEFLWYFFIIISLYQKYFYFRLVYLFLFSSFTYLSSDLPTLFYTHLPTYLPIFQPTYPLACPPIFQPTYPLVCPPTFLPIYPQIVYIHLPSSLSTLRLCIPTFLPIYILNYSSFHIHPYLPTYLPSNHLPSYILYLPTYSYFPIFLYVYLPTYLPT